MEQKLDKTQQTISSEELTRLYIELIQIQARIRLQDGFINNLVNSEWNVLPFGLKNAPQIFQRRMDQVFRRLTDYCIVYVDDILIYSNTLEDHIKHLEEFIGVVKRHGILLSKKKSEIFKNDIEYLGYIIDKDGIQLC